jgi:hypothetical protein
VVAEGCWVEEEEEEEEDDDERDKVEEKVLGDSRWLS